MTEDDIIPLFTRADGSYAFARWGRPIAPVVFGVTDETLVTVKGALEAVIMMCGHETAETDPELGANLMMFFFGEWDELLEVPNLDQIVPNLAELVASLKAQNASQYRLFRFDNLGAIQASFVFLRMNGLLGEMPAEDLALSEAVQIMLLWSEQAFAQQSPLARLENGTTVLRPDIAGVIRCAYDPVMPWASQDASHAMRLSSRLQAAIQDDLDDEEEEAARH